MYNGVFGTLVGTAANYAEVQLRMGDFVATKKLTADFFGNLDPMANNAETQRKLSEAYIRISSAYRSAGQLEDAREFSQRAALVRGSDPQAEDYPDAVVAMMSCIGKGDLDCTERYLSQLLRTTYDNDTERDLAHDYTAIISAYVKNAHKINGNGLSDIELAVRRAEMFFNDGYAKATIILLESQFFGSNSNIRPVEELDLIGNIIGFCSVLPDDQSGVCLPALHRYLQTLGRLYAHIEARKTGDGRTFADTNNPPRSKFAPVHSCISSRSVL
jgi:tetratricopeptide (TPR) repeat protein